MFNHSLSLSLSMSLYISHTHTHTLTTATYFHSPNQNKGTQKSASPNLLIHHQSSKHHTVSKCKTVCTSFLPFPVHLQSITLILILIPILHRLSKNNPHRKKNTSPLLSVIASLDNVAVNDANVISYYIWPYHSYSAQCSVVLLIKH